MLPSPRVARNGKPDTGKIREDGNIYYTNICVCMKRSATASAVSGTKRPKAAADPPSERAPVARDAGILSAAAVRALASDLDALPTHVEGCVRLLAEGHTVPFIARYRQPETGGMAPPLLRRIDAASRDAASLAARCDAVVAALLKTDRLTAQLEAALRAAPTLAALEDVYAPHKSKPCSLAERARALGCEPAAQARQAL